MKIRDLSWNQFVKACQSHGMRFTGFMGYVEIGGGHSVSHHNAGPNRRRKLAYLLAKQAENQTEKSL